MSKKYIFLVDFDGTCVTHDFPNVGRNIGAEHVLKKLTDEGHKLVLFTMRCNHDTMPKSKDPDIINKKGNFLDDAVEWFDKNNIPLYGIQTNPTQHKWTSSPKAYGHFIIDDTALGVPLKRDSDESRAHVDWCQIEHMLRRKNIIK